ncbi:MAG: hypothetical protein AB4352_18820 [Hormoscilla sp.]
MRVIPGWERAIATDRAIAVVFPIPLFVSGVLPWPVAHGELVVRLLPGARSLMLDLLNR